MFLLFNTSSMTGGIYDRDVQSLWMSPYPVIYILFSILNDLYCIFYVEMNKHSFSGPNCRDQGLFLET